MAAKSKRSSKPTKKKQKTGSRPLDQPFSSGVLSAARKTAGEYKIIVSNEDGHWYGHGLEMPHVFGDGPAPETCIADTQQALTVAVAYLLEQGRAPPTPARSGKRTQQVNVRLTAEEKVALEGTARRKGFEGLSDFIRAAALESAR